MKNGLLFIIILFCSGTVSAQTTGEVIRLSEPVQETGEFEIFEADVKYSRFESPSTLSEIINSETESGSVSLATTVAQVCRKKGVSLWRRMETTQQESRLKITGSLSRPIHRVRRWC